MLDGSLFALKYLPPNQESRSSGRQMLEHVLSALRQADDTAPGGLELASGMAWRTAAMISFIICHSSMLRLLGGLLDRNPNVIR
jgi:hypothetical protein